MILEKASPPCGGSILGQGLAEQGVFGVWKDMDRHQEEGKWAGAVGGGPGEQQAHSHQGKELCRPPGSGRPEDRLTRQDSLSAEEHLRTEWS